MGLSLSFQTFGKHKCIVTDVISMEILPSGFVLQVYLTLSCLKRKSFFSVLPLSLLSLTSKQLFPSLILLQKCFHLHSPLISYPHITQRHLIRDENSCKESCSHMYFLFQDACLKIQNKQCKCPFKTSSDIFKWDHSELCIHPSKCF